MNFLTRNWRVVLTLVSLLAFALSGSAGEPTPM
jgi:hypothetical protein